MGAMIISITLLPMLRVRCGTLPALTTRRSQTQRTPPPLVRSDGPSPPARAVSLLHNLTA